MPALQKLVLLIGLQLALVSPALSDEFSEGLLQVDQGTKIYFRHLKAKANQPTFIFLNGLTYDTTNWDRVVSRIQDTGAGVVLYDMRGQGKTFAANGPVNSPIPYLDQVNDLKKLIDHLQLNTKPTIVGLSYGGGIGLAYAKTYPKSIEHAIILAPYVKPLEGQDQMFRFAITLENMARFFLMQPQKDFNEAYSAHLERQVKYVYPLAEPGNWDANAIFNLTEGIRHWNALEDKSMLKIPEGKISLYSALFDQYVDFAPLRELTQILGSRIANFERLWSEHKVPESNPDLLAHILRQEQRRLLQLARENRSCKKIFN
jgi:pimeloyl-ACP methyl ester carboxylesterase